MNIEKQIKRESQKLVSEFKVILMDEDTDCGHEILCTLIAIKLAKICVKKQIEEIKSVEKVYDSLSYTDHRIKYLNALLEEIEKV